MGVPAALLRLDRSQDAGSSAAAMRRSAPALDRPVASAAAPGLSIRPFIRRPSG